MKTKRNISLVVILLLAMGTVQTVCAKTQSKKTISRNYDVSAFHSIETDIVGNIVFTQSPSVTVRAEGHQESVDNLIVRSEGGILTLKMREKLRWNFFSRRKKQKLTVYISSPDIKRLESDGVGNVCLDGRIETENFHIDSDGVGNIEALQLFCQNLTINSDGVGNIRLSGKAHSAEYCSDGVGNIKAEDFDAENLIVKSSGVGNVRCRASQTIELHGSGIGNISYYGNPSVKKLNKNGIGKIKQHD